MISINDRKLLALYSCLTLIFLYPLIQAGVFYRDDLDRAITGQYGWRGLGRPVADILMKILSASGHYNLDLFPYTMIVSCLLIGASCLLLSQHLTRQDVPHANFIASLLIFNPYLLQNLAYRYDSLGMALAFLFAVLSYTYSNNSAVRETTLKLTAGILALTLYQPCTNIFIALLAIDVLIIAFKNHEKTEKTLHLIVKKTVLFVLFNFIYMVLFAPENNTRAKLVTPDSQGFEKISHTVNELSDLVSSYFYAPSYIYFLLPLLVAVTLIAFNIYQKKIKTISFLLPATLALLIFSLSLMGPTIFLQDAPVLPRAIVTFSVIFILISILIVYVSPRLRFISLIPVITAFAFSAQLSSTIKSQYEYEDFVFSMITRDLINHPGINTILTTGQVNLNERAKLLINNKPVIHYFVSPAGQFLASFQLINKGLTQTTHGYGEENDNKKILQHMIEQGTEPTVCNPEYCIYIKNDLAMIKLGNNLL